LCFNWQSKLLTKRLYIGLQGSSNSHKDDNDRPKVSMLMMYNVYLNACRSPLISKESTTWLQVRMQSYIEMQIFGKRWKEAAKKDQCWIDPYEQQQANQTSH